MAVLKPLTGRSFQRPAPSFSSQLEWLKECALEGGAAAMPIRRQLRFNQNEQAVGEKDAKAAFQLNLFLHDLGNSQSTGSTVDCPTWRLSDE